MKHIKNIFKNIIWVCSILVLTNVLWGKEIQNIASTDNKINPMMESEVVQQSQEINPNVEEVKTEVKQEKPVSIKSVEDCVNALESQDETIQLLVLNTCAKEYQKNDKMQDALLKLLNDSDNETVQINVLMLLSNQKKDKIAQELINLIQKEKFQTDLLKYASTVVLYSNMTDKTKSNAKEIFQNISSTEEELLKHLAENLSKKD